MKMTKIFTIHREFPSELKNQVEEWFEQNLYKDCKYENGEIYIVVDINKDQAQENK